MGQATFANNTTIKIGGSISQQSALGTGGTLYTVAANGYAEMNLIITNTGGTTVQVFVGGRLVFSTTAVQTQSFPVVAGPTQAVTWTSTGTIAAGSISISGVLYLNSP